MVVQNPLVKGGIAAVVNGYRNSKLEKDYKMKYVESYKDGGKIIKLFKAIKGYFQFGKVLILEKPEIVHIHSSFGPSFYRKLPFIYLASWVRIPIINHIHGADFDQFYTNASARKKKIIKKAYDKCSIIIALSEEWKERLSSIVDYRKIRILENYSILHEDAYTERLKRACNNQVLFLGELGCRKGCYDIPLVAEKVAAVVPNVRFILGGTGNEIDEKEIKNLVAKYGVENIIEFPGWVREKQKEKVLRDADVFYLPSYNEGMPMSVLDAMGYGLPIVSTNVGGIPKLVHNGVNGICCDAGDINTMATGIIDLLTDDKLRNKSASASIDIAKKRYSLDVHIQILESIYEELLNR